MPDGIPGGYERYLAPTGPNGAYYPQALFVSSRGFGFMLNQPEYSRWRMGNDRRGAWQVQVSARELDYTVALGPTRRASVRTLTAINGRHRLPPAWAQGPMLVRARRFRRCPGSPRPRPAPPTRPRSSGDLADMTRYGVRPSAYAFEGWALLDDGVRARADRAPASARRARGGLPPRLRLRRRALHAAAPATTRRPSARPTWPRAGGQPYVFGSNGGGAGHAPRLHQPATLRWWRARLELLLDAGADGFMQDFGEQVQDGDAVRRRQHGQDHAQPLPGVFHRASRRIVDALARARIPAATPLVLHARRLQRPAGQRRLRDGHLPRRRDRGLERGLGPALAGARHAQPRRGRRLRLHHGHRRLLGPAHRPRRTRSCTRAGPSGRR